VMIRCSGHCRFRHTAKRSHRNQTRINLLRFVHNRRLAKGTVIDVSITKANTIGRVRRLRVKPRHGQIDVQAVTLCRSPGAKHAARHCASIR
jgi:hypothetical protein